MRHHPTHYPPSSPQIQTARQQVELYGFARERAATTRLPRPFVPIRDRLVLPCFRAVENTVQFMLSDRPVRACVCVCSSAFVWVVCVCCVGCLRVLCGLFV
jgi:hypothetical protein